MKHHWFKRLYRVTGWNDNGLEELDVFVGAHTMPEAVNIASLDDPEYNVTEWRVRECPTPEKFNSHWLKSGWGANHKIRKMQDRRNYKGTTIYQIDHDYRMNRLARALLEFYRTPLNLQ